jgi:hypothetical protein
VGSGDDGVGVQEGTTAEVGSTALKRDDVGELASGSGSSANDVLSGNIIREGVVGVLRSGRRKNECGKRNSEEGCETHGECFDLTRLPGARLAEELK